MRPRAIVMLTIAAAAVVFLVVQDRVTASGARRYVALQRAGRAGIGTPLTLDAVMAPAIRRSVQQAVTWSGIVLAIGFAGAAAVSRADARHASEARRE
jgi:hypothetical protein